MIIDSLTPSPPPLEPLMVEPVEKPGDASFLRYLKRADGGESSPEVPEKASADPAGEVGGNQENQRLEGEGRNQDPLKESSREEEVKGEWRRRPPFQGRKTKSTIAEKELQGGSEGPKNQENGDWKLPEPGVVIGRDSETLMGEAEMLPRSDKESGAAAIPPEWVRLRGKTKLVRLDFLGESSGSRGQREDPQGLREKDVPGRTGAVTKRAKITSADTSEEGIEITLSDQRKPQHRPAASSEHSAAGDTQGFPKNGGTTGEGRPSLLEGKTGLPSETEGTNIRVLELGSDSSSRDGGRGGEGRASAASFGEILKERGIGQLVKQTGILLRDDSRGRLNSS